MAARQAAYRHRAGPSWPAYPYLDLPPFMHQCLHHGHYTPFRAFGASRSHRSLGFRTFGANRAFCGLMSGRPASIPMMDETGDSFASSANR